MKVRLLGCGSIEVDGDREYEHDVVIEGGRVRQRKKKPSKPYRNEFGHTPLSADEELPWPMLGPSFTPVDIGRRGARKSQLSPG